MTLPNTARCRFAAAISRVHARTFFLADSLSIEMLRGRLRRTDLLFSPGSMEHDDLWSLSVSNSSINIASLGAYFQSCRRDETCYDLEFTPNRGLPRPRPRVTDTLIFVRKSRKSRVVRVPEIPHRVDLSKLI